MATKLRPLGDKVLVKRVEAESRTESGIFLPDTAKEKAQIGKVIAVGGGKRDTSGTLTPVDVAVGDLVYFGKYAGTEVDIDKADKNYLLVREDEILGVVEQ